MAPMARPIWETVYPPQASRLSRWRACSCHRRTAEALAAFDAPAYEIKRIHDSGGLDDVADVSRQIGRTNVEEEKHRLALALRDTPNELSVHVAYVDGEPVACGRISQGEQRHRRVGGWPDQDDAPKPRALRRVR